MAEMNSMENQRNYDVTHSQAAVHVHYVTPLTINYGFQVTVSSREET
jgi:hypothetical protein